MGNHKFRLSDMIPNAWFYKLRDMGRTTKNQYTAATTTTATTSTHHSKKKKKHHQPPPPKPPQTASSPSTLSSSSATTITMLPIPPPQQSKPTTITTTKQSHQRKSYYFTRDLTVPLKSAEVSPRKSSSKKRRKKNRASPTNKQPSPRLVSATVSAGCSCRTTLESVWTKPDSTSEEYPDSPLDSTSSGDVESLLPEVDSDSDHCPVPDSFDGMVSLSTSCHCKAEDDIVIDVKEKKQSLNYSISTSPELPPIKTKNPEIKKLKMKTKPMNSTEPTQIRKTSIQSISMKIVKKDETFGNYKEQRMTTSPVRRLSTSSPGVRLRTNSPRIASKKIQAHARKSVSGYSRRSLSESFAVVKSSVDPQRDFRESMVEMIMENNLKGSKDLEDLLACYLQLNSDDYHEVIIRVFKQIWLDLADLKLQ